MILEMSNFWKLLDWIIGGIVTIFYLYTPMLFEQYGFYSPFMIPEIVVGLFLIYCFISGIYWSINKNFKIILHYILIILIYICLAISLLLYSAYHG